VRWLIYLSEKELTTEKKKTVVGKLIFQQHKTYVPRSLTSDFHMFCASAFITSGI